MSLDEIGLKYKTDKASWHHDYLKNYEFHLSHLKDKQFVLFEIGVSNGNSLRMWSDFFPRAAIYGTDIDLNCMNILTEEEKKKIYIFIGDQSNTESLRLIMASINSTKEYPTVIIDDGSHQPDHILTSFKYLWPYVKNGGYYILEDLHSYYLPDKFTGRGEDLYDFLFKRVHDINLNGKNINGDICGDRRKQYNNLKTNFEFSDYERSIESISFYKDVCIIKKGELDDFVKNANVSLPEPKG